MGAITDIWKSERGLIAVALIAAAFALCGFGTITVQQWLDFTKWLFVTYAAAKTITSSVGIVSTAPPAASPPAASGVESILAAALSRWAQAGQPTEPPGKVVPPIAIVPDPPKAS